MASTLARSCSRPYLGLDGSPPRSMPSCSPTHLQLSASNNWLATTNLESFRSSNQAGSPSLILARKQDRGQANAGLRQVIRAASLRGRFPETPLQVHAHPPKWLQVARLQSAESMEAFRERLQENPIKSAPSFNYKTLEERLAGGTFRDGTTETCPWYLMELSMHCEYSQAYDLEAEGLGFIPTGIKSVFSVPLGHNIHGLAEIWSCMLGLRFVMEPLARAEGPDELIAAIVELELKHNLKEFCFSHEKLAPSTNRIGRKELRGQVVEAIGDIQYSRFGTLWSPERPRFAVIESASGYIFGHVVFAPSPLSPDYSYAPHKWSAGIPPSLAGLAVNIAGSAGDKLVDPCCGLGTILFEAQRRGLKVEGYDLSLQALVKTCHNLDFFQASYLKTWGEFCSIFGPHNPRTTTAPPLLSQWLPASAHVTTSKDTRLYSCDEAVLHQDSPQYVGVMPALQLCTTEKWQGSTSSSGTEKLVSSFKMDGTEQLKSGEAQTSEVAGATALSNAGREMVYLAMQDARTLDFQADCVVSNLPFGRFLKLEDGDIERILLNLSGRARKYVFFFGSPLTPSLQDAGYVVAKEVSVCQSNKRYMSICTYPHLRS